MPYVYEVNFTSLSNRFVDRIIDLMVLISSSVSVLHFKFIYIYIYIYIYRVSQEEGAKLQKGVPYVKLYRYNLKHLYPKLNGYGDNGQRKVWTSCISA